MVKRRQSRERLDLAKCVEPCARPDARSTLPALEQPQHMDRPERRPLKDGEKEPQPQVGRDHDPLQAVHLPVCRVRSFTQRGLRGLETGRLEPCAQQ